MSSPMTNGPAVSLLFGLSLLGLSAPLCAQVTPNFVNWETPHVHPLELTPDKTRLLAVNIADARIEVFDVTGAVPLQLDSFPTGVDPVSVRARTNTEIWVVNQISDSVSIVDLTSGRTVRTLATDDEPADVVFTATRAFVSCSQTNTVLVYSLANLSIAPTRLALTGEDPRALSVSADGARVYVAIEQSGNGSTVIGGVPTANGSFPPDAVSDPAGPYQGVNPPPNGAGNTWVPPKSGGLPTPPPVPLIVKKNSTDQWVDDRGTNWTNFVSGGQAAKSGRPIGWDLTDNDVAVINTTTLSVFYAKRLMNLCMSIAVVPGTGDVVVVGTEAINEVRFEPNVNGRFVRVKFARIAFTGGGIPLITDLNPHLNYSAFQIPQSERDKSIGDPRAVVFSADGARGYVAGMGSNNVIVINAQGQRAGLSDTISVGAGPTGLALDDAAGRLYVLDKFEAAISVVDTASELEIARHSFHDASPPAIKLGRRHFYGTRNTSGLGQ
ncbi:MAG TPA: beta-propeller fold lactonase family protein, partial [Planctomycetota bacterium]|nr:beta-propeller fold lactonase family protein [Planctomycetota bacterium]